MKVYKVEVTISGMNGTPEPRVERIISGCWAEVHELMARICRDTGCVILETHITQTDGEPLEYRAVKSA